MLELHRTIDHAWIEEGFARRMFFLEDIPIVSLDILTRLGEAIRFQDLDTV